MTAKSNDEEFWKAERIYMPVPLKLGRGNLMGRGPYEKSGLIEDTGLPPGREVRERFEIPVAPGPAGGEVTVTFRLLYLPFGTNDETAVTWREESRKVAVPAAPR